MGTDNSLINQFKQTHFSRKGAWGAGAEEKYNLMLEAKEQAPQQETPLNEKQIVKDVLVSRGFSTTAWGEEDLSEDPEEMQGSIASCG
ncbi:hypothetical protein H6P81_013582 [Aristolochia fimbriata]|uniref:Uncharacterized protein n=1 Tax=Aristolochia fimbriata TaxID=158543 RepID=A0AAV7EFI0_ARIFI|nr:hypothetical protein H6P81_013582 [Aristolochia fimbriata]